MHPGCLPSGTSSPKTRSAWIWPKCPLWLSGLRPPTLSSYSVYRLFIRNYSCVAASLTALTSTTILFRWTPEVETAFIKLKHWLFSAPVLIQPDIASQFTVEVDSSEIAVGAVLSQRSSPDGKLHPCAFFSRKLSPAERNYDVGNRELLAVVLALEE